MPSSRKHQKPSSHKAAAKKPTAKPMLAAEEWDFTNCPYEELVICNYYEHAREVAKVSPPAPPPSARDYTGDVPPDSRASLFKTPMERFKDNFTRLYVEFPATPYLQISSKLRVSRCIEMQNHFGAVIATDVLAAVIHGSKIADSPLHAFLQLLVGLSFTKGHTAHLITIDWSEEDAAITKSFSGLLSRLRPDKARLGKRTQRRGRSSPDEQLMDLAALRLVQHFDDCYETAMRFAAEQKDSTRKPSNNNLRAWSRCVKRAQGRLLRKPGDFPSRHLFESLPGFENLHDHIMDSFLDDFRTELDNAERRGEITSSVKRECLTAIRKSESATK